MVSTDSKSKELDGALMNFPQAGTVGPTLWASLGAYFLGVLETHSSQKDKHKHTSLVWSSLSTLHGD